MKKCSHSHHHALAELNITPLLDLAFVLLVIFIITTTPVVNDLDIDLPSAANRPKEPKSKVNYVTVESSGKIFLNQKEVTLANLSDEMDTLRLTDPDLNVVIRGSAKTKYRNVITVMNALQEALVLKVNLATDPIAEGTAKKE
jgi:biopolymer transport protein ExbD